MKFSTFITDNIDAIVVEWEAFARTLPAAQSMSGLALRDHCREILTAIALDMETSQTEIEQTRKSKHIAATQGPDETPAESHGTLRHLAGFDLVQLVAEFRALRASVLSLWHRADESSAAGAGIDEITRFNEGLDQALAESIERYSANVATSRDIFLGILGHDLRGPLATIGVSNQMLARADVPSAKRQEASARIGRCIHDMNRLITDLLDYTRSQLGAGIPIERSVCDIGSICREAIDSITARQPQQRFALSLSGDLGADADGPKLGQALDNLLSNAVQHGDRSEPILLTADGQAQVIVLKVMNRGAPIPQRALRVIFEPLAQVPSTADDDPDERSQTSVGLGLFIVREIVNGHLGEVTAESSAEAGTVFTVRLPRGA